ncbi:MAG TPA: carboxylesterase family protein [Lapillicoccus sp.]|nr:carboxylesterase family protein [Lapillicoccus sp.]
MDPRRAPEVDTAAGRVRGLWRDGSAAFLGIPFAEPPVGDLRFAAPVPARPWPGTFAATRHGPTPQRVALSEVTLIPEPSIPGEATLNVDVYTPAPEAGAALPVLVWIHGGGYVAGSPASPWYDGRSFNRDGVVTVCVSYRLGFDGFGWIDGAPANRGVLDWLMALEWVQANIAAFGGDPRQVTIAGQSAGGGAVLTLLGMEGAQHLFARVFSLSGALGDVPVADARRRAGRLAELAGVPPTLAGFRSVDEARLLLVQRELGSGNRPEDGPADPLAALAVTNDGLPFGPMVDGELIRRSTLESLRAGVGADKPLVAGAADDEIDLVSPDVAGRVAAIPPRSLLSRLGLTDVAVDGYLATHDGWTSAELLQAFLNDRVFRVDALVAAQVRRPGTTWLYRYAWRSTVFGLAIHCIDVPFWFDCLDADRVEALTGPNPPQSLADRTHGAAVAFIRDGDPGWPAYIEERQAVQVFDEPPRVVDDGYRDVRPLLPS